jgi:hypothetical protein
MAQRVLAAPRKREVSMAKQFRFEAWRGLLSETQLGPHLQSAVHTRERPARLRIEPQQ